MRRQPKRPGERGFALLLVFVMAAAVALLLYQQMPRVAFESERDKEQLLIDRGAQYQRAIQVYFITFKRFPARIEDLENTNDHRFLRKRYLDPYTGKSEWRLIHTNGMMLTDSKVQPPPNPNGNGNGTGNGNGPANGTGTGSGNGNSTQTTSTASGPNGAPATPPAVNATVAARPSDRTLPNNASYANPTQAPASNQTAQTYPNYNDPVQFPPISLFPNGYNATQPGQNGQPGQPGQAGQPGLPGQPGVNQAGVNQPGFNQPSFNQPGFTPGGLNPNQAGGIPQGLPNGMTAPNLPNLPVNFQPPSLNQANVNQTGLNQTGGNQPNVGLPATPVLPGDGTSPADGTQQFQGQLPNQQPNSYPPLQTPVPSAPVQSPPVQQSPGQQMPVQQMPMQQMPGQPPAGPGQFNPTNPGAGGAANPGLNLINQLLTTPRPAPSGIGATTNNQQIGGGIAGVASMFTGATIKSYGGRTDYSEWEFVYQLPQQQTGIAQTGQQQNGQQTNGQQTNGQQGFQPFSGSGSNSFAPPPGPAPTGIPSPPPGGFPSIPSLPTH